MTEKFRTMALLMIAMGIGKIAIRIGAANQFDMGVVILVAACLATLVHWRD